MSVYMNMIKVMLAMGLILSLFAEITRADSDVNHLDLGIKVSKLEEGVWIASDIEFYNSNTLLVKFKDESVLIVSSPFENKGTRVLMEWVKKQIKPRKMVAINTHFHRDGTGGNMIYHQEGVETWASELTNQLLQKEIDKFSRASFSFYKDESLRQRIKASPRVLAKNTFKLQDGHLFHFAGERVQVFFPGHAHSPDNVVVYIPDRKILFGGCMIKPKSLGYLGNANIAMWPKAARRLKSFDVQHVIPGHGSWGTSALIDKTIKVAAARLSQETDGALD